MEQVRGDYGSNIFPGLRYDSLKNCGICGAQKASVIVNSHYDGPSPKYFCTRPFNSCKIHSWDNILVHLKKNAISLFFNSYLGKTFCTLKTFNLFCFLTKKFFKHLITVIWIIIAYSCKVNKQKTSK